MFAFFPSHFSSSVSWFQLPNQSMIDRYLYENWEPDLS
jgi:hypothetical protein